MKKILITLTLLLSFLISNSQTVAHKGLYIDSFDKIIGIKEKEDSLLSYLKDSSYNSITCYSISKVISSSTTSSKNIALASFIKRARTQYGIKTVMASSENYNTFKTLVSPYNRSRTDSMERFNYYYLEFEFWNVHSTSPVSSTNNGYYCTNYLSPGGYKCDTSGAFKYYKKMLTSLDSLATKDGIKSATYIGNPNQGQAQFIARTVDFLLIDNYTSNINNIYTNIKTELSYFGSTAKVLQFAPIFASYSPGGIFLGDWLTKAPTGPHSEKSVYNSFFLPKYNAETGTWKQKLNLRGYQWYRYSGMPRTGSGTGGVFCNIPTNITLTKLSDLSVQLNWPIVNSALGYVIQYSPSSSSTWLTSNTNTNSITIQNLLPGKIYNFQIKSSCISTESEFSSNTTFQTACLFPASASYTSTYNSILLTWDIIFGIDNYSVKYRVKGTQTWSELTSTLSFTQINNLLPATTYEIQINSICETGVSTNSNITVEAVTKQNFCTVPTNIIIKPTHNSISVSWNPVQGALSYNVFYKPTSSAIWIKTNSTSTMFGIGGLTDLTFYDVKVQTVCVETTSDISAIQTIETLVLPCPVITGQKVIVSTTNSVTVFWDLVPEATSYNLLYKKSDASSWSSLSSTDNSKNITSLLVNTTYQYKVQSICQTGVGELSNVSTFTTFAATSSCGTITNAILENVTNNSVNVTWVPVLGAKSYVVEYRKSGSSSWTKKTTSFYTKQITGLSANTKYEFRVQVVCDNGSGIVSKSIFGNTLK